MGLFSKKNKKTEATAATTPAKPVKIYIVFYSTYGHIYKLAEAIKEGASKVAGVEVSIFRVPETLPTEVLEKMHAVEAQKQFESVPIITPEQLVEADAIIFGTPTRFGNMAGQMKSFLDATGQIWATGGLVGKVASVFTSSATQHGGQESTILTMHTPLLHHGMILVGVPFTNPAMSTITEMTGGGPYGSSTITGGDGARMPSENELVIARFQGQHVATVTAKLVRGVATLVDEQKK